MGTSRDAYLDDMMRSYAPRQNLKLLDDEASKATGGSCFMGPHPLSAVRRHEAPQVDWRIVHEMRRRGNGALPTSESLTAVPNTRDKSCEYRSWYTIRMDKQKHVRSSV